jgi:hypothetical protein
MGVERLYELTHIDPWFLYNLRQIVETEELIRAGGFKGLEHDFLLSCKKQGFSDKQIAYLTGTTEDDIRTLRRSSGVVPRYTSWLTPAALNSSRTRPIATQPTSRKTRPIEASGKRSSSSAADPTGSARASNSTTAACTPHLL